MRNKWAEAKICLYEVQRLEHELVAKGATEAAIHDLEAEARTLARNIQQASDYQKTTTLQLETSIAESRLSLERLQSEFLTLEITRKEQNEKIKVTKQAVVSLNELIYVLKNTLEDAKLSEPQLELTNAMESLKVLEERTMILKSKRSELCDHESNQLPPVVSPAITQENYKLSLWADRLKFQLEKNRELRNKLMSVKKRIRVFCRIRHTLGSAEVPVSTTTITGSESKVKVCKLVETFKGSELDEEVFTLDRVFGPQQTNEDIFFEIEPLVQSALQGEDVCVFAYGQTSAGKTYTMISQTGIVPQSVDFIFRELESMSYIDFSISVQCFELYLESLNDLFVDYQDSEGFQRTALPKLTSVNFKSAQDIKNALEKAQLRRKTTATATNSQSSRSHFIFAIEISTFNERDGTTKRGELKFVDLAGSEKIFSQKKSRIMETKAINSSLCALATVIQALHVPNAHVPYRASKLTKTLAPSLTPASKILMVVNVAPEECHTSETLNSLRFAARANADKI